MKILFVSFLLSVSVLTFISCGSSDGEMVSIDSIGTKPDDVTKKRKGENEGTPLDLFIKDYVDKNPDFFNNSVIEKKKTKELDKQFEEAVNKGILNGMVFTALTVGEDIYAKKPECTFTFSVMNRDSLYAATVFVRGFVSDSVVAKIKEGDDYKLVGNITVKKETYGVPHMMAGPMVIWYNDKIIQAPKFQHHGLRIDLKDVVPVNN